MTFDVALMRPLVEFDFALGGDVRQILLVVPRRDCVPTVPTGVERSPLHCGLTFKPSAFKPTCVLLLASRMLLNTLSGFHGWDLATVDLCWNCLEQWAIGRCHGMQAVK